MAKGTGLRGAGVICAETSSMREVVPDKVEGGRAVVGPAGFPCELQSLFQKPGFAVYPVLRGKIVILVSPLGEIGSHAWESSVGGKASGGHIVERPVKGI